jgi:hypothetical protein
MTKFLSYAATAALALGSVAGTAAFAQPADAPVVETQANPPGEGVPTATPPDPATAAEPVAPAQPADPNYNAGPYKGALTSPPPAAANKVYPVCSRTVTDSCRNRGGK